MSKQNNGLTEAYSYILFALTEPLHGYGIMQKVEQMSQQTLKLGPGTLYGALTNMEKKGWIESAEGDDSRRKNYQLTTLGIRIIENEASRIKLLDQAAKSSLNELKG